MAKANAAKQRAPEAASVPERGEEVQSGPLQKEAQDPRVVEQTMRENSAAQGESAPRGESTLERAVEARKPGWRHIGRVPGAPDPTLTETRRPPQLPTEVCERIIEWMWNDTGMLRRCALVCRAWTPRDMPGEGGHSHNPPAGAHSASGLMGAAKLPVAWHLAIQDATWRPGDFHPHVFFHLSAFSSVTALWLFRVTFPKVREFGRLVCALPSLARLRCADVLFTSTAPYARLAITQHLPSVRLADLQISSSDVEATKALLEHLCAAGVVADLQNFELASLVSSDNKYLDDYREPLHELLKQCGQSLRSIRANLDLHQGKDLQADAISDTISSVFDLTLWQSGESDFEILAFRGGRICLDAPHSRIQPGYSSNIESNLQAIKDAFRNDLCPQLDELFSQKVYENLRLVDFVFLAYQGQAIPDATRWSTLIRDEMPKLDKRGIIQTRLDVILGIFHEYF
ncbi:hypothetical protein WOLCODRAFT_149459 [Wolfiporia cocos MD-104 SS10]|uniref:F-box domain-containing protein n=1 Tax=Wolfiporia cocos (strain MD-104) TaxID=742152 RepID=A0A2H3J8D8_WOLCO|nr:hypothetical protein WOLCODRAFT_149459 [Wolfiporia cocos MD-104 SS10]